MSENGQEIQCCFGHVTAFPTPRSHGRNLVGDTEHASLHFFRWGDIICHVPPFFSLGFVFGEVLKISDVCHILCEELFMLHGRPHIAKFML